MFNILIEALQHTPVEQQSIELVERKGTGHPDSICDGIMEEISLALCREYLENFGRILHHNVDKGLLVAGRTEPHLGGGRVMEPMRLVIGDRATARYGGKHMDVGAIAEEGAKRWFREHLRFVDPEEHLTVQSELKEGSPELMDIFEREAIGANDTSAAVGYAPLTQTERIVLATEHYLNSPDFKKAFPEAGEDVKVMGYRKNRELTLVVALAFVDRFISDAATYFARKHEIHAALQHFLLSGSWALEPIKTVINALDDPARGEGGMYLTVLGTSAEGADCGQVGRGNRVNGLIPLNRPMSTEAAAGKNPVSHVGKIYSLLTHAIAAKIHEQVSGLSEVYVWLCSQIGQPVDQPLVASVQLVLDRGAALEDVKPSVQGIMEHELETVNDFIKRLTRGELPVW